MMLKMFLFYIFLSLFLVSSVLTACENTQKVDNILMPANSEINPHVKLSMNLLEAIRNENALEVKKNLTQIGDISLDELVSSLNTKQKKLAFWINMYNALVQVELIANPEMFEDKKAFYKDQRHKIAGINMSYDNIEHGILRNSRVKLSLGYVKRIFVKKWERQLRNKDIDGRIHFALNCGAKDCPPVAIFDDVNIDSQLDKVNKIYLTNNTTVERNKVTTSPLFSWFRADFGGLKSVDKFLTRYDVIPNDETDYQVEFKSYDWTLLTGNYIDL